MKFHKPLFSVITILIQLVISIRSHYKHIETLSELKKSNPELAELICISTTYKTLFIAVFIIGFYEMQTKSNRIKIAFRIALTGIVLGALFSEFIPIDQFYFGVYNTACFIALFAVFLTFRRVIKRIKKNL